MSTLYARQKPGVMPFEVCIYAGDKALLRYVVCRAMKCRIRIFPRFGQVHRNRGIGCVLHLLFCRNCGTFGRFW